MSNDAVRVLDVGCVIAFAGDLDKANQLVDELEDRGFEVESSGMGGGVRDAQLRIPNDFTDAEAEELVRNIAQRLSITVEYASVYEDGDE